MVLSIHCNTVSARFSGGDGTVDNCSVSDRDRRHSHSQADDAAETASQLTDIDAILTVKVTVSDEMPQKVTAALK